VKARGSWTLITRPKHVRVLPSKVVLKIKRAPDGSVDRYKARLVALGCLQKGSDCDETFSPVVDFATVRTALTLAVSDHETIHHIDVT
jgi:Reverse transcriptase (RNA-dependent DNA polymerase)